MDQFNDREWFSGLCLKLAKAITAGYDSPTPAQGVAKIVVEHYTFYLLAVVRGKNGVEFWLAKPMGEDDVEVRYFTAASVRTADKVCDALPMSFSSQLLSYYYDAIFDYPSPLQTGEYEEFPIDMINMHPGHDPARELSPGFMAQGFGTEPVTITFYNGNWYCFKGAGSIYQARQRGQNTVPVKRVEYKSINMIMNLHRYPALRAQTA